MPPPSDSVSPLISAACEEPAAAVIVPERGDAVVPPSSLPARNADDVAAPPATGAAIDARSAERYLGQSEPPGAVTVWAR